MSGPIGRLFNMITEVKTEGEVKTERICPLMSGQIVPVPGRAGRIDTPGATTLAPSVISCAREKCQWWDELGEQCTLQTIAEVLKAVQYSVTSVGNVIEPASESPLARIGDVLATIDSTLHSILTYWKTPKEKVHPARPTRGYRQD